MPVKAAETRRGAIAGISANLLFTIWATLTEGGKILNLGRFNFPWHDYMIGAVGHVVLLAAGIAFSLILLDTSPSDPQLTLWGWLDMRRLQNKQKRLNEFSTVA